MSTFSSSNGESSSAAYNGHPSVSRTNGSYAGNGATHESGVGEGGARSSTTATNGSLSREHANGNGASAEGMTDSVTEVMEEDETYFTPLYEGSRLDRREFIRITLQSLRELGFDGSAKSLEVESGVTVEHASIVAFRQAILAGDWKNAERLLIDGLKYGATRAAMRLARSSTSSSHSMITPASPANIDLVLREPQRRSLDYMKFLIYQQRYLELLEAKQTSKALSVLRSRLAPLNHGSERLHQLSSLVICGSSEELRARANWLGSGSASRRKLLEDIESAISPTVMIPSRRLPQLLEQAQQMQKLRDPFYTLPLDTQTSLYVDHQSSRVAFPTYNVATLSNHTDEVWHIAFSHDGTMLASASKDKHVIVWRVGASQADFTVLHKFGPLSGFACHVAFSPNDKRLLGTSDDGEVVVWDLQTREKLECKGHAYTVGSASWLPNGEGFVSGGMDNRIIFWDADGKQKYTWSTMPFRVQALDVSPDGRYVVAISHRYPSSLVNLSAAQSGTSAGGVSGSAHVGNASSQSRAEAATSPGMNDEDWTLARADGVEEFTYLAKGSRTMGDKRFQLHFYDVQRQEELGSVYLAEEMTSVTFSEDSRFVLINQRPDEAQLWDVERQSLVQRFISHRIQSFVIRSCFGGAENSYVISGSEDGFIYLYHRKTGELLERLRGHGKGSVNSVAWNPQQSSTLASCGDDGTVRVWRPAPEFDLLEGASSSSRAWFDNSINNGNNSTIARPTQAPSLSVSTSSGLGNGLGAPFGLSGASVPASSNGREREASSDAMGPTPFPWATSPRGPTSPQRRNRRNAAARRAAHASTVVSSSSSRGRRDGNDDDEEDDAEDDNEDEEEDDEEDEEEEDEDEDDEDNAMEEGAD